jgi:putative RNA 2'-phosphotransferase
MSSVYKCEDDELYFTDNCPSCGSDGKHIVSSSKRRQISKFLSGLLRHFPEDYNLKISNRGWADTTDVFDALKNKYSDMTLDKIYAVVSMDDKGRYEVNNGKIRATYGHSVDVNLEANNDAVPDVLYHGTSEDAVPSIMSDGLKPMSRQHVHLTDDEDEAQNVGGRHSKDVVLLIVNTVDMMNDGIDIVKRGKMVYTCDKVPSKYIEVV